MNNNTYFITCRSLLNKPDVGGQANVIFDLENNSPTNSVAFCRRVSKHCYIEMGSQKFIEELRRTNGQQLLFYIHGFNNLPEEGIFTAASSLQKSFNKRHSNLIDVIPIIWPCDNDLGLIKDYWDDQKAADMSGFSLARALCKFIEGCKSAGENQTCSKRVNILAHSMGNRVLRETFRILQKYDFPSGLPLLFRNIFLVAADIVNTSLEYDRPGEFISDVARNVVVYHANDDLLLRASKALNLKNKIAAKRLGLTGPADLNKVPANIYVVDCDDVNNKYDTPFGHSYFFSETMLDHLFHMIKSARFSSNWLERHLTLEE